MGITQALFGSQKGILSATLALVLDPDAQASAYHNFKNTKYLKLANLARMDFLPVIFTSSGRPHLNAKEFIYDLVLSISQFRKIPPTCLHFYITKRLSCVLQKALLNSFNKKISLIHSRANGPSTSNLEINDHAIIDSEYINIGPDDTNLLNTEEDGEY